MSELVVKEAVQMAAWFSLAASPGLAEFMVAEQQGGATIVPIDELSRFRCSRARRRLATAAPDRVKFAGGLAAQYLALACQPEVPEYSDADYSAADFRITEL